MANEAPSQEYQPRDPMFYALAAGLFASALHPDTLHESDAEAADKTGHLCARMLDRGLAPHAFLMPKTRRVLELVHRRELLDAGGTRPLEGQQHPVIMTEGEKQKEREALAKAGPIPARAEVMAQNEKQIQALTDLSEPVRMSAMLQACFRISARSQVTGARPDEALTIVVEEVERALRNHRDAGNPTRDIESTPPLNDPSRLLPYPASIAIEVLRAGAAAMTAEGEAAPAPAAPTGA